MFNVSNQFSNTGDFKVILVDKKSNLSKVKNFLNVKICNELLKKALNNKRGHSFISEYSQNKFINYYLYKVKKNQLDFVYQDIGGSVISEALSISKNKIEVSFDYLSKELKHKDNIIKNVLIGMLSRNYCFKNYKLNDDTKLVTKINLISNQKNFINKNLIYAKNIDLGVSETRNLVTKPANILNPQNFVNEIKKLSKTGLKIEVLDEIKLKKLGMNALLGVGQGSSNKSFVAIMKWNGGKKNSKPLGFVGKGVCFDTGGISLKPARFMEEMKYDMAGAGTVTGLMKTLALRKARVNAVGVVGLVENMPDGNAQRPGDVVKSYSGQTIEIFNTDAEGRLVLADILTYTEKRFKPKFMINLATLTGAIIVSLGNEFAGLFSNNDQLAERINKVGYKDNEKAWRLPLDKNFDKLMDSKIADMQNINYSGGAGSITAAQFLQRFIMNKTPWAHLDIAGMAWTKKTTKTIPYGATGYGVKLLNRLVEEYYE
ncbi:leucyl aminopeptidase, partial [Pelagibacteraceae bacterium]|nr:leucyl aminopeptidase [Pelagibacteraceae bacterium]